MAEQMADIQLLRIKDLSWEENFVWVQRTALIPIIKRVETNLTLRRHDGEQFSIDETEILKDYFFIDEARFLKPRYMPQRALCAAHPYELEVDGNVKLVEVGGAVLTRDRTTVDIVSKYVFERDYSAVAYPGHIEEPITPFPDR